MVVVSYSESPLAQVVLNSNLLRWNRGVVNLLCKLLTLLKLSSEAPERKSYRTGKMNRHRQAALMSPTSMLRNFEWITLYFSLVDTGRKRVPGS